MARCSYCYKSGHKRPTCPEYRKYLERDEAAGYLTPRETKDLQRFRNRDAGQPIGNGTTRRGRARKKSTCSFCGSQGHNLRKCPALAKVKADYAAVNQAFRALIEPVLSNYGPGALVEGGKWYRVEDDDRRDTKTCKQEYSWTGMVMGYDESNFSVGQMLVDEDYAPGNAIKVKKLSHNLLSDSFGQTYNYIYQAPLGEDITVTLDWHEFYSKTYAGYEELKTQKAPQYSDGERIVNDHKRRINSLWSDFFGYSNRLFTGAHGDHCELIRDSHRTLCHVKLTSPAPAKTGLLTSRDPMEGFDVLLKFYTKRAKKRKSHTISYFADALLGLSLLVPEKKKIKKASETLLAMRKKVYEQARENPSKHSRYRYYGYSYSLIESYM